jgi:hypothetical protein
LFVASLPNDLFLLYFTGAYGYFSRTYKPRSNARIPLKPFKIKQLTGSKPSNSQNNGIYRAWTPSTSALGSPL